MVPLRLKESTVVSNMSANTALFCNTEPLWRREAEPLNPVIAKFEIYSYLIFSIS